MVRWQMICLRIYLCRIQAVQVDGGAYPILRQKPPFDAPVAGRPDLDWAQLDTTGLTQPFFIAGGLNEDNKSTNTLLPMQ